MTTVEGKKRCTACGLMLPMDAYTIRRDSSDGHAARCRPCLYAANKQYRINARENPRRRDHRRSNEPWQEWEYRLIRDHLDKQDQMLAPILRRTTSAVRNARYRLEQGKVQLPPEE